jgi:Arc/MetJ family transcription regulator
MRTNIEIDDKLMEAAMAAGGFKTKREAVEAGLRLVARRKVYDGLRALRGKLHWDDSDESWATLRTQPTLVVNEASPAPYAVKTTKAVPARRGRTK